MTQYLHTQLLLLPMNAKLQFLIEFIKWYASNFNKRSSPVPCTYYIRFIHLIHSIKTSIFALSKMLKTNFWNIYNLYYYLTCKKQVNRQEEDIYCFSILDLHICIYLVAKSFKQNNLFHALEILNLETHSFGLDILKMDQKFCFYKIHNVIMKTN